MRVGLFGISWHPALVLLWVAESVSVLFACLLASQSASEPAVAWTQAAVFGGCIVLTMVAMGLFTRRMRDRMAGIVLRISLSVAAGGAFVAWLAHTSVDWLHNIPGVTGVALCAAAALVSPWARRRGAPISKRIIAVGLVALACVLMVLLIRSPWGRVIRSVREEEDAARSLGKNVFVYRLQSLVLGGVLGAVGGMLLAAYSQAVQPDAYNPAVTFYLYTLLILGGAGRLLGPVVGSVALARISSRTPIHSIVSTPLSPRDTTRGMPTVRPVGGCALHVGGGSVASVSTAPG